VLSGIGLKFSSQLFKKRLDQSDDYTCLLPISKTCGYQYVIKRVRMLVITIATYLDLNVIYNKFKNTKHFIVCI